MQSTNRSSGLRGLIGFVVAGLLTAFAFLGLPAKADATPVVLTIHGGGYYSGSPDQMGSANAVFEARGYEARSVEYMLENIGAGWRDVKRLAESFSPRRNVYAFGISSGGGYAAKLAERGIVDGAYGFYPLVHLTGKWIGRGNRFDCTTEECRRRFSPALRSPISRYRASVPLEDTVVDPDDALRWAKREKKVTAFTYHGEHGLPSSSGYEGDVARAANWFGRR